MNYFEILNVAENAEDEVIRASYRALAKKYHPDNTELDADVAAQKMQEINEACPVVAGQLLIPRTTIVKCLDSLKMAVGEKSKLR